MKKSLILFGMITCLLMINVKAEELPTIISHQVMVTNKDGTVCFSEGKKTDKVIPYKTMLTVSYDISGSYIRVTNDKYDCDVKYSDVSSNTQKFNLDTKGVNKITPVRALILPNTGLNMRIGPAVTYAKRITIPQNTVITLTHKAGTYWYYTEYNNITGWVTAMNRYIGYDYNRVLINHEKTKIYDTNGAAVLTNIPENTEITDYIKLETFNENDFKYYVSYNGNKGYVKDMLFKTNGTGKIRLIKDVDITDENGKPVKKMTVGSELEYTMVDENNNFYFNEKKVLVGLNDDDFEYIKEVKPLIKEKGYIGEGIFGEEKLAKEDVITQEEVEVKENEKDHKDIKEIVIIALLAGIFLALIAIVIIKIRNNKDKEKYNF